MFDPSLNSSLTFATLLNGDLVGANAGTNGISLANYKGNVVARLECGTVLGSGAVNINVRLLAHTNADQNAGAVVGQYTLVTNAAALGGESIEVDPRNINQYLSAQCNVLGTNANAYPTLTVLGYSFPNS